LTAPASEPDICVKLGRKIQELRRKRGWRQIDLAAHAELSKTHINELEAGKREIGFRALVRVAEALDMKVSDLTKEIGQ
jgi:transcriptional regulator with XRE-family HTH domain